MGDRETIQLVSLLVRYDCDPVLWIGKLVDGTPTLGVACADDNGRRTSLAAHFVLDLSTWRGLLVNSLTLRNALTDALWVGFSPLTCYSDSWICDPDLRPHPDDYLPDDYVPYKAYVEMEDLSDTNLPSELRLEDAKAWLEVA